MPYFKCQSSKNFDLSTNLIVSQHFIQLWTGEHNLRTVDGTEQIIPIDKIIVHPNYDSPTTGFDYDVALIKLKEPINYNINVRPVCLPTMDFPPGTNCYVTGWGYTTEGGNFAQVNILIFCYLLREININYTYIQESLYSVLVRGCIINILCKIWRFLTSKSKWFCISTLHLGY